MKAFVFLCLVASASASNLYWVGGTTNFSDTANWLGGVVPGVNGTVSCSTTFGSANVNIISQLSAQNYFIGQVLTLPSNGALRLTSDGTVLTFTDFGSSTCTGPTSVWTGGLVSEQRNDFYCHENWINDAGGSVSAPPCDNDFAYFDSYSAYHVSVLSTVSLIVLRQLQLGSVIVTSNTTQQLSLVEPQIDLLGAPGTVYIGSSAFNSVCKPLGQANLQYASCYCYSSCPTPSMLLTQQQQAAAAAAAAAALLLAQLNTYYVRPISGTMSAASLYMSVSQLQSLVIAGNLPAIRNAVVANLLSLPSASVTNVQITLDGSNDVVFTANINATLQNLLPVGSSSTTAPTSITWISTTPAIPVSATRIQSITQSSFASTLLSLLADNLANQLSNTINSQSTTTQDLLTTLSNLNTSNFTNIANLAATNNCLQTCTTTCASCTSGLADLFVGAGLSNSSAYTLATDFVNAKIANMSSWPAILNLTEAVAASVQQTYNTMQQQLSVTPIPYSLVAPFFYIGRSRLLADQLAIVAPQNVATFNAALAVALTNFQNILNVWGLTTTFVSTVPSARRRRSIALTPSALQLLFSYNISCRPSDLVCQAPLTPSSPLYIAIQSLMENIMNNFALTPATCRTLNPNNPMNFTCLLLKTQAACLAVYANTSSVALAHAAGAATYFEIAHCGPLPTYPNGSCLDQSYASIADMDATMFSNAMDCTSASATLPSTTTPTTTTQPTTTSTTTTTTAAPGAGQAAASSSGGGGFGMMAGAAGGGAAIIIVIIVIVLLRRRKSSKPTTKAQQDRTVVAFENPMYDDPTSNPGTGSPIYADASAHDAEGLYDEPAFNAGLKKANPVYESTDNLAEGGEPAYAETSPERVGGDGYLDVSPNNKAEDAGYLASPGAPEDAGYLAAPSAPEDAGYLAAPSAGEENQYLSNE